MKLRSKILIIAGSDSSGGAGIQADIKTVTALGSYAMTAITAVTAQNTTGVKSIIEIDPKEILNQIIFTSKDIRPDAIKIGMLNSSNVIKSVLKALDFIKVKQIVLDPVMVAKGGAKLIDEKAKKVITDFKAQFEKIDQPSREILEPVINGLIESNNTNFKGVGQPLRIVLTGSKFGPGIYDIILSLGKKEVQKRLDTKIAWNYGSSFCRGRGFRFDFI